MKPSQREIQNEFSVREQFIQWWDEIKVTLTDRDEICTICDEQKTVFSVIIISRLGIAA